MCSYMWLFTVYYFEIHEIGSRVWTRKKKKKKSQEEQQINVTPNIFQHLQSFFEDKQFPQEFPQEFNTIILEEV